MKHFLVWIWTPGGWDFEEVRAHDKTSAARQVYRWYNMPSPQALEERVEEAE